MCRWMATFFVTDNNVDSTVHRHYNCHGVCSLMNRPIFSNLFYLYLFIQCGSCVCINRLDLLISFAYRFRWLSVCVCVSYLTLQTAVLCAVDFAVVASLKNCTFQGKYLKVWSVAVILFVKKTLFDWFGKRKKRTALQSRLFELEMLNQESRKSTL